eukprot:CAMPEP_0113451916 /NCGR_PEP_ID=MMETSP0014_2-20120614/6580_1 /TAXON_ID=2857 /ORGANISM="Nitzschia sp." /LENGTH=307 /DNA_ID=CAMNT_0000343277 /DNA_START=94 /DNA_END=1017 /DNA_ORIENTATION=- /assembly_acc=CAM_ASM_000159
MEKRVIVVDYDDTLLPSSFCERWKIEHHNDLPLHFQNMMAELSDCAERFLREASKYGEVLIITNSDEGWVQYSAERFCPKLASVVMKYPIISARTKYEKFWPGQPLLWKSAAFAHEINEIYERPSAQQNAVTQCNDNNNNNHATTTTISLPEKEKDDCASMESTDVSSTSSMASMDSMDEDGDDDRCDGYQKRSLMWTESREIISFGDSTEERTAVSIVANQMDAVPKSIKLMGCPTLIQIIGQLHMLTNHMQFVCESTDSLDLHITDDQADTCAESYLKEHRIDYDEKIVPNYVPRKGSSQTLLSH